MRGSHFAPWCMNQIYDVHYGCYYSAHAGRAVKHPYEAPDEPSVPHTHLQTAFFMSPRARLPGQTVIYQHSFPPQSRTEWKESLCVRDWTRGERESERPRGRSRGQAKALFVLILAHELGFSHTQPDSLHWIRPYRTRLLSRPPDAVFFPPATYCTHVKKPKTWLKPQFSSRETVRDHNLKGIIHPKIIILSLFTNIYIQNINIT